MAAPQVVEGQALPLSAEALSGLPKLHDAHDLWPVFLAAFGLDCHNERGLRLSQTSLAIDAAIAGQGVALVSRFLVARDLEAGRLVQVRPEVLESDKDFYLLAMRRGKRSASAEIVYKWLLSVAGAD